MKATYKAWRGAQDRSLTFMQMLSETCSPLGSRILDFTVGKGLCSNFQINSLVQKQGVVHWPKSLWDLKNEVCSLYFNDFTLVRIISLHGHYINIMFH
jgi:hypothetical protein